MMPIIQILRWLANFAENNLHLQVVAAVDVVVPYQSMVTTMSAYFKCLLTVVTDSMLPVCLY